MNRDRRLANKREKAVLFVLQDGKCNLCGCELTGPFEADHLIPFSHEGNTDLCNLQLLCLNCHSEKTRVQASGRRLSEWPKRTG